MDKIAKGTKVRVKKGTVIRTTKPGLRTKVASRDQVVTVNHSLTGWKITPDRALRDREFNDRLEEFGVTKEQLEKLMAEDESSFYSVPSVVIIPASVVWAGTGGYWHEVPVSCVEIL